MEIIKQLACIPWLNPGDLDTRNTVKCQPPRPEGRGLKEPYFSMCHLTSSKDWHGLPEMVSG